MFATELGGSGYAGHIVQYEFHDIAFNDLTLLLQQQHEKKYSTDQHVGKVVVSSSIRYSLLELHSCGTFGKNLKIAMIYLWLLHATVKLEGE